MYRTQIYLTDEERSHVESRARDAGVSQAEVIRRILDREFGIGDDRAARIAAVEATAGLWSDYPEAEEITRALRGPGADERLRSLGL